MKKIRICTFLWIAFVIVLSACNIIGNDTGEINSRLTEPVKTTKNTAGVEKIANEISRQLEENEITINVNSFYIPKILSDSDKEIKPKISKNLDSKDVIASLHEFDDPLLLIGNYKVLVVKITYFELEQSTQMINEDKETKDLWHIYSYHGKEFALACVSDDNYVDEFLINFGYWIDSKTQVFISATSKEKIDTEAKAISVFKDFECFSIEDLKE